MSSTRVDERKQWHSTHLNEVLALSLGHQRLKLRGGESIDETGLGHHQEEYLGTCENGEFVGLFCDRIEASAPIQRQ